MLNRTPSSRSTFFRLTPTFLTARLTSTAIGFDRGFGRCVDLGCVGKSDNRPTTIPSRPRKHINIDRAYQAPDPRGSRAVTVGRPVGC